MAVYRCGSYNKASKQLGLSQPAISKQISSLENQLGKKLFKRSGRGVESTQVGEELANALAQNIDSIELTFNQSRKSGNEVAGTIHIGAPKEFLNVQMIPALSQIFEQKIKIKMQITAPDKMYKLIRSNCLDLAIVEQITDKNDIGYRVLFTDELVLVAAPKWRDILSGQTTNPQSLSAIPLLARGESFNYIDQYYLEAFNQENLAQASIVIDDVSIIQSLLREGTGYSVLPRYLVAEDLAMGRLIELHQPETPPSYKLHLIWNKFEIRKARTLLVRDIILGEAHNH